MTTKSKTPKATKCEDHTKIINKTAIQYATLTRDFDILAEAQATTRHSANTALTLSIIALFIAVAHAIISIL